jgi:hypothetical protein
LVGSLVDSYGFKDSGLVKKTMSVTVLGVTHHLGVGLELVDRGTEALFLGEFGAGSDKA